MSTFVSLTVHCARCHDHKFDPIPQRDYYRLQAVFAGVDRGDRPYDTGRVDRTAGRSRTVAARRRPGSTRSSGRSPPSRAPSSSGWMTRSAQARRELADVPRPQGGSPSPSNGYHSAIHPDARCRRLGPGRPGPLGADRRGPPGAGPAGRFPRHARLRLPAPLPGRGVGRPGLPRGSHDHARRGRPRPTPNPRRRALCRAARVGERGDTSASRPRGSGSAPTTMSSRWPSWR